MLPDPLHFLAATNPISEFAASRNLLCNCLHTHLELRLICLDHIVMLDEFLHLQSQNTEFKPNWDNEFRFSETLVATLSKMVITEILLMQKTTCKRSWNPRWVKSNMVSHLSYQCIVSCFLTTKNNLTFKTILTESGKKKEQKQRDALVYNSRPFNNGYPLDTTKLLVIKSNNDSISSHKGKMVETGWQGVMEIYNVCEMKAWEERSISPPFPYPFWNSAPNKENGSESVLC